MKVVFCSNFFNHHQLYFSKEMYNHVDIEYTFIANEQIPDERLKLGYEDMNNKYPFIIRAYESEEQKQKAIKICNDCDVLIIGSASDEYINERMKQNKLTFRYNERIFKRGVWRIINPRVLKYLIVNHVKYKKKNLYMLCASAYTSYDFSLVGAYKNKCYKWGYFPETKYYDIDEIINDKRNNENIQILWAGRFIDWKHPELAVKLAKELKEKGYMFKIKMIGTGPLEKNIDELIKNFNLQENVQILGSMSSNEVRTYMEKANIFIATSDQNEGWGAVVNEAMNSACVVVANKKIGSVPYLIENNNNGLIYSNKKEFFEKVEFAIEKVKEREYMSKNAYYTIINDWNARKASEQLINLCYSKLNNQEININKGPCSKA